MQLELISFRVVGYFPARPRDDERTRPPPTCIEVDDGDAAGDAERDEAAPGPR